MVVLARLLVQCLHLVGAVGRHSLELVESRGLLRRVSGCEVQWPCGAWRVHMCCDDMVPDGWGQTVCGVDYCLHAGKMHCSD